MKSLSKKAWKTPQLLPLSDTNIATGDLAVTGPEKQVFYSPDELCATKVFKTGQVTCSSTLGASEGNCDVCS